MGTRAGNCPFAFVSLHEARGVAMYACVVMFSRGFVYALHDAFASPLRNRCVDQISIASSPPRTKFAPRPPPTQPNRSHHPLTSADRVYPSTLPHIPSYSDPLSSLTPLVSLPYAVWVPEISIARAACVSLCAHPPSTIHSLVLSTPACGCGSTFRDP